MMCTVFTDRHQSLDQGMHVRKLPEARRNPSSGMKGMVPGAHPEPGVNHPMRLKRLVIIQSQN